MNIFKTHLLNLSRLLIAAILVVPALEVQARGGPKPADPCLRVVAEWNETGYFADGAPECNGFDFCIRGELEGTPEGEMWLYSNYDLQSLDDPYGRGLMGLIVGAADQTIHTGEGDIYMKAYGLYETNTTVFTELSVVIDGTGKYAGATGQMVAYPDASRPANYYYSGPLYYKGRICPE